MNAALSDSQRLAGIRASLAAIEPGDFRLAHDGQDWIVERLCDFGELAPLCRFDAGALDAERDFVVAAPSTVRFLLKLVDRAIDKLRANEPRPETRGSAMARDPKNFAAECAMKCKDDPAFRVFLEERHGLERPLTDERVNQKVRSILGVQSRKELNDSARAADAWKALRGDYETWRKRERA
jgi:hypothetical protein